MRESKKTLTGYNVLIEEMFSVTINLFYTFLIHFLDI